MEFNVYNIKINNPCPVRLNRMQKVGNNYFCSSCSKTVIDFQKKTESEIKHLMVGDICGIFTNDQLKTQQKESFLRQKIFFFVTILSFLGFKVEPLKAQTIDSTQIKPSILIPGSINKNEIKEIQNEDGEITDKRRLFRRKEKQIKTIGCPSF